MHYLWRIYSKFFYLLYNYTVFLHKLSPICNGYEKSEEEELEKGELRKEKGEFLCKVSAIKFTLIAEPPPEIIRTKSE